MDPSFESTDGEAVQVAPGKFLEEKPQGGSRKLQENRRGLQTPRLTIENVQFPPRRNPLAGWTVSGVWSVGLVLQTHQTPLGAHLQCWSSGKLRTGVTCRRDYVVSMVGS